MTVISESDRLPKIWLDNLEVLIADGVDEAAAVAYAKKQLDSYPPAIGGIEYIPLSDPEGADVLMLTNAACELRRHLGLGPVIISAAERVHLVGFADFVHHFGLADSLAHAGHVYLPERARYMSRRRWLAFLSHEIAHLSGHLSAEVVLRATEEGNCGATLKYRRSGMKHAGEGGDVGFIGLDEAVTEIAALQIRSLANRMSPSLGGMSLGGEDRITGYFGQVILVEQLAIQLADVGVAGWSDRVAVIRALLADYFSGSDVFLETLAEAAPAVHEFLHTLGDSEIDGEKAYALSRVLLI